MTQNCISINGEIVSKCSDFILDRGLQFGDGLFESMRSTDGKILELEEHYKRLLKGADTLGIPCSLTFESFKGEIQNILTQSNSKDVYIKIIYTRGLWKGSIPAFGPIQANLIIICKPFLPFRKSLYENGFKATLLATLRNDTSPLANIKSLNYLDNVLGRMHAINEGFDEGIFLNTKQNISEGTASNLFIIKSDQLLTPPISDGVLAGITRYWVLKNADQLKLKFNETSFSENELLKSKEAFLTNALMGIVPMVTLDKNKIGNGRPGRYTKKLRQMYEQSRDQTLSIC